MSPSRDSLVDALSMKGGTGEHSYATNSHYQRSVFYKIQHVMTKNVREMLEKIGFPDFIKVTDLGCSTGQNTVLAMSAIANTIMDSYQQMGKTPPEIYCYLNDLPENDFNTTFKLVPSFLKKQKTEFKERCFVSGVPGSFYSRLFPRKSLHFVHSAFSIHWLSKIPDGLEGNTKSIHIKHPYTPNVYKSYLNQFKNDFSVFLKMRSEEIVHNGHMVLTFVGRKASNTLSNDCFQVWSLLSDCLRDLASEGFVKQSEMESFNMPFYNPSEQEVRDVIFKEGSFEIKKIDKFDHIVPYKIDLEEENDEDQSFHMEAGIKHARWARCITEPLLVAHFGDAVLEPVFNKYAHYMAKYLSVPNHRPNMTLVFVISLIRK
ncbi:PREDICTED: salicylate/benzoate carboxyl methyltransferase-like [Camelina sativa]|uniref:Salicylate/benzoate carboxyl methyltransferase-like n=1 Tax=Camelina sativa TaxID=90675 RepID=A0ABM0XPC3_CAMSA|nr:PREDICTED: salicylate/benzoate carboxyl methyltransferase-like [Camelina sativa]